MAASEASGGQVELASDVGLDHGRDEDSLRAPDEIEPILAWRAWSLRRGLAGCLMLAPIHVKGSIWPARSSFQATCAARGEPGWIPHRAPGQGCRCGVHAATLLEDLPRRANIATEFTTVVGAVALWGTIVEHERGYRSEFAYPVRIRLVCPGCQCLFIQAVPDMVFELENGMLVATCYEHLGVLRVGDRPVREAPLDAESIQGELLATYAVDLLPFATLNHALLRAKSLQDASVG